MRTKILAIIATIMLLSSVSAVNFTQVFAQDAGFGATTRTIPGITNKGVTGAQPSNTKPDASIKLAPNSGPPGSEFAVYGIGFEPLVVVTITDPFTHEDDKVKVDNSGTFSDVISVPSSATPGTYRVEVDGAGWSNSLKAWHSAFPSAYFEVTKKVSTNTKTPKPPVNAPKPPTDTTTPANTATGGSSIPYITLDPTSGFPGTEVKITGKNFEGEATLSAGGKAIAKSSDVNLNGNFVNVKSDGSLTGQVTIPSDAQPGPYPIQVDSSGPIAKAIFTVLKEPTFANTKTTPTLKSSTTSTSTPGKTGTNKALTIPSGASPGVSSNSAKPTSNPISKRPSDKPQNSGVTFLVSKGVDGGDAKPEDFSFIVTLTGPSGSAKYPLHLDPEEDDSSSFAHSSFNLDLPQGTPLSEGNYQIIETNPGDYVPDYSKGCSGTYENEGYMHTCYVTNTKPGDSSYDRQVNLAGAVSKQPQPVTPTTPGKTGTSAKSLTTSSTTSSSTSNSGSPKSNSPSNSIVKNSKSGASFYVIKTVVGGDANPADFNFNVILTGPSGSAKYSLNLNGAVSAQNGADSEFNLNLPQGNTMSEGSFQIVETNPMGYTPTYDKGCSGTYDMDGYRYICHVTNTKVIPSTTTNVARGGTPPQPIVPTGKTTLPTTSNTGKLTLPTTSNTGKLTLPTTPTKPTITLPTTPTKSTITKPPAVHSCPTGSIVANGKCVSKGKVVGVLQ